MIPTSKQSAFIAAVAPGAQAGMKQYGILASVTIAQAALESGWGKHTCGANNLFGIKANGWAGKTVTIPTREQNADGTYYTVAAAFRAYASFSDSVEDHGAFLAQNERYRNLLWLTDYAAVCTLLQRDGYATELDYARQLTALIKEYGIDRYDLVPKTRIDLPAVGAVVTGAFGVGGWAISKAGIARVDVYADGKIGLGSIRALASRPDVGQAYPQYPGASRSGYSLTVPAGKLKPGRHTVDAAGIAKDGTVCWMHETIAVK